MLQPNEIKEFRSNGLAVLVIDHADHRYQVAAAATLADATYLVTTLATYHGVLGRTQETDVSPLVVVHDAA